MRVLSASQASCTHHPAPVSPVSVDNHDERPNHLVLCDAEANSELYTTIFALGRPSTDSAVGASPRGSSPERSYPRYVAEVISGCDDMPHAGKCHLRTSATLLCQLCKPTACRTARGSMLVSRKKNNKDSRRIGGNTTTCARR